MFIIAKTSLFMVINEMLKVKPLAFDSFGVRSMATFVETDDIAVLIDPGVSLAPSRYNLPPHPMEEQRMSETWAAIKEHAARSDILVVTHYHYDHHDPAEPEIYSLFKRILTS